MAAPISLVVYTRDRHPPNHCSFKAQGGLWPVHCVDGTKGFDFHPSLPVVAGALILDKATQPGRDAYSGFDGTSLADHLRQRNINRCVVAGLATDYCVKATVLDARRDGFETWVLVDAVAAVNVQPGDEQRALVEMQAAGAKLSDSGQITTILTSYRLPTALIIVDVQNDFCTGGALAVPNAERIMKPIKHVLALAGSIENQPAERQGRA